ncbi:hypothetical protein M0R45_011122 [Rubus argutus]|uniref:Uncharacterized protein n=1 Tax=Rubus argutus TaxID=59490 RepID=A0AAW1Y8Y3_RUBAR
MLQRLRQINARGSNNPPPPPSDPDLNVPTPSRGDGLIDDVLSPLSSSRIVLGPRSARTTRRGNFGLLGPRRLFLDDGALQSEGGSGRRRRGRSVRGGKSVFSGVER